MSSSAIPRRLRTLAIVLVAGGCAVVARLVWVQLLRCGDFEQRARNQHEATVTLYGQRGAIYDRNGRELAVSLETDSAYADPGELKNPRAAARTLATILNVDRAALESRLTTKKNFAWIKRKVTRAERARLEALGAGLPVHFTRESFRYYPKGPLAAHALGFVNIDGDGMEGVERDFDGTIRGDGASFVVLRDALGGAVLQEVRKAARPGADLELTLDEAIQHAADAALEEAMEETQSRRGAVIFVDPRTGEILAMASRPGFDPNQPGLAPPAHRKNTAIGERYEPGSTFKIITAAAALEEGRVRPGEVIDCGNGSIVVSTVRIRDHHPYAALTFTDVIAKSSNVGAIRVGLRLGAPTLHGWVDRFGFGRRTGIGLRGEAEGTVHAVSKWSQLSVASVSMGQEVTVTPLQMLQAFSTIANDGVMRPPRLVRAVVLPDGRRVVAERPEPRRVISAGTARTLTMMMQQVVETGTGKAASIPGFRVAGKTGTAQKIGPDGRYSHTAHTASFVGFVPADEPRVAGIVVLDDPQGGAYYGGEIAAPVFEKVAAAALDALRVSPDAGEIPPSGQWAPPKPKPLPASARTARPPKKEKEPIAWPPRRRPGPAVLPASAPAGVTGSVTFASLPGAETSIPDLFGLGLRDAVTEMSRRGLRVVSAGTGFVVDQDPAPGSPARPPALCRLTLSLTPPEIPEESDAADGAETTPLPGSADEAATKAPGPASAKAPGPASAKAPASVKAAGATPKRPVARPKPKSTSAPSRTASAPSKPPAGGTR